MCTINVPIRSGKIDQVDETESLCCNAHNAPAVSQNREGMIITHESIEVFE